MVFKLIRHMKISAFLLPLCFLGLLFSSCVTRQSYEELEAVRDYYQSEAEAVDSISLANQEISDQNRELELQLKQTLRELEELAVANQSLSRNYEEILDKYNKMVQQSENELTTYSYEKLGLQEQLAAQQAALDERERDLAQMEYDLYQKESQLNEYDDLQSDLNLRDQQIQELKSMLSAQEEQFARLRESLNQILGSFSGSDLTVTEKDGKMYVSLSQELLFRSGSDRIESTGRNALQQVARALRANTDFDVIVEGHTDADGSTNSNWDLSVQRATSVVKLLVQYGVNPDRITAAGRGEHLPVASNASRQGKALNRRTEIILSPKLTSLYNLINK